MEFQDVVRKRKMVRSFEDRPIPPDVLDRILANALHAPSAGFSQGWAFVVLEGPRRRRGSGTPPSTTSTRRSSPTTGCSGRRS